MIAFDELAKDRELTDVPIKLQVHYMTDSVLYTTTIRVCYYGIECPACGELVKQVTPHPAGRGLICAECREKITEIYYDQ